IPDDDEDAPWTMLPSHRRKDPSIPGPLPESIELVLADQIYVAKETLSAPLRNRLVRLAAFQNPEFYRAQAMRLWTSDKSRIIHSAEDHPKHIALPRGCLDEVRAVLSALRIKVTLQDSTCSGGPL